MSTPPMKKSGCRHPPWRRQPGLACNPRLNHAHGEPAGSPGFPIEAPCRHMRLERSLEGRHQRLKLIKGQTGEIQELRGAGPNVSEPYTSHGVGLLSLGHSAGGAANYKSG